MVAENKFLREQAQDKYHRTHDFDLIAGKYYDQKKEQEFVRTRERLMALQGQAQQHRLPPSIRYGEGNEYDIINKEVCDNCDSILYVSVIMSVDMSSVRTPYYVKVYLLFLKALFPNQPSYSWDRK